MNATRWLRPTSTILALLSVLSVGVASHAAAPTFSAEDEAIYKQRLERLQNAARLGLGLESYDTLESVPGAKRPNPLPAARPADIRISAGALAAARDYAAANNSTALLIWHRGKLVEASYFGGATPSATFASRSLAKPMTAVAIGRAIALGKIKSLDQPVADFVTEWQGDARRSRILVRHLLDMRSGFLAQSMAPEYQDILNRAYLHPRHGEIIVHEYPLTDEPGTRYEYNNAIAELVALVIERATGVRYGEFISREILQRIDAPGGEIWVDRPGGLAHSGCCLMVPPETYLRLAILLMQDGRWQGRRLLPEGYVDAMRTATAENPYYGLGVYVPGPYIKRRGFANPARDVEARRVLHSEPYLTDDLFLFDGNSNQVAFIVPSKDLIILRVGNDPPRKDGREWDNSFLPNTILRGLTP